MAHWLHLEGGLIQQRQPDLEDRAATQALAERGDGAAMQLDQALADEQADPKTTLRAVQGAVGLGKEVEDDGRRVGAAEVVLDVMGGGTVKFEMAPGRGIPTGGTFNSVWARSRSSS